MTETQVKTVERSQVISGFVTSDGTSGPEWGNRLSRDHCASFSDLAMGVLRSPDFGHSSGKTYGFEILRADILPDDKRTTENVNRLAIGWELAPAEAELACLLCDKFGKEGMEGMGLTWLTFMHRSIKTSGNCPGLQLNIYTYAGTIWVSADYENPLHQWGSRGGFVYLQ